MKGGSVRRTSWTKTVLTAFCRFGNFHLELLSSWVVSQVYFGTLRVAVRVTQINSCFVKVVTLMPKLALSALGVLVRKKRGARKLREVAKEIGITAPTLMRIEAGRVPDVSTFGKVC